MSTSPPAVTSLGEYSVAILVESFVVSFLLLLLFLCFVWVLSGRFVRV